MAFSFLCRHRLLFPKFQTLGSAGGDTGGFQPLIDPILAVVAFDHFAELRLPLRRAPGTGGDACLAADTKLMLDKDNAVAGPLLHGACRTGGNAPGVLAMKAEHENEGSARQASNHFRTDLDYLA